MDIRIADSQDIQLWNSVVEGSPHGTIFHRWEWCKLAETQSKTTFLPLMIFRGSNLMALYPVFIQRKGVVNLAFSPPPHSYLLYQGPILVGYEGMKQDKKESLFFKVQEEFDKFVFSVWNCRYIRIRTAPGLYDSRPLLWSHYKVEPYYTYAIDLTKGIDGVWEDFDRKLRVDIKKACREGVDVKEGGSNDLPFIQSLLSQRFIQQGYKPLDYLPYLNGLYSIFQQNQMKIFLGCKEGDILSGLIALFDKDRAYLWTGIPKYNAKGIPVNDLIQWEVIKWAAEHGYKWYEEMDSGDDRRLTQFKSKYNPTLQIWFSAERYSAPVFQIFSSLFKFTRKLL
ncbi:MAG: GNAT family N-acetyltransferase [Methanomicrobiales archaeon]|nr:GNAT family N-acetyltransferase [Methanomicrobiales archaeon]